MSKNSLIFGRALFTLVIIIIFGLIIINEKGGKIFLPKVTNKINDYINEKYNQIEKDIIIEKIDYNNKVFKAKIVSKHNNNLYFYIIYKNKKIYDTYKKDYIEGNSILNYLNKKIEKEINEKTNTKYKVYPIATLDKYTNNVKDNIIKEQELLSLKYYYLEKEITTDITSEKITNIITKYIKSNEENSIKPKYYKFIIINKNDSTNVIQISNITEEFVYIPNNEQIIKDILNKNNSILLEESKIKYKYLNEEE